MPDVTAPDDTRFGPSDNLYAELLSSVLEHYWKTEAIRGIVEDVGLPKGEIRWQLSATEVWPEVIRLASTRQRLQRLLDRLGADPDIAVAARFRRFQELGFAVAYGQGTAAPGAALAPGRPEADPYATAMVGPRPFIDRTDLRQYLRQMLRPDGSRVLVVTGAEGCGKSHTWFAISHVAESLGAFRARSVDLSRRAGGPAQLDEVMDLVASRLFGGRPAPVGDRHAQDETRISRFVSWLATETEAFDPPVWLVFDGFVPECASPSAQQLVTAIATAADRQELPKLRVTVLGFAGRVGPDVLSYALRDTPAHPGVEDLRRFFRLFAESHRTRIDQQGTDVLVEQLLDGRSDLAALDMGELSRRAHELALAALGGSGD